MNVLASARKRQIAPAMASAGWLVSKPLSFNALALGMSRVCSMAVAFAIVPLALGYLGTEQYGLWMAVTSLVFMVLCFMDGGAANALVTATARAMASGGNAAVQRIHSAGFVLLTGLSLIIVVVAALIVPLIPWRLVFSLSTDAQGLEAGTTMLVAIACVALAFGVQATMKVRTGLQEIIPVSVWDGVATASAIPALLAAIWLELSLPGLVLAVMGTPLIVRGVACLMFVMQRPQLRPRWADAEAARMRPLLAGGTVFLVITMTQAIAIQSDQLLIAHFVGLEDVAAYSIQQRLFTIPFLLANLVFAVQWPALAAADARGEHDWVRVTFARTLLVSVCTGAIIATGLMVFNAPILSLWIGDAITPSFTLVAGMTAYAVLMVIVGACSTLLISLDVRGPQIWVSLAMMALNLPLSIYLIGEIGAAGAIIGTAVAFFICMVVPYAFIIPRVLGARAEKHGGSANARSPNPTKKDN